MQCCRMVGLWLVVLLGTLAWWYGRSRHRQRYWWRRGVPQTPPPSLFNPAQMIASMTPGLPQVYDKRRWFVGDVAIIQGL